MCRSIKTLRRPEQSATDEEVFNSAVDEIASASVKLLASLTPRARTKQMAVR